jgi:biopolymer transport protein ExbD
MRITGHLSLGKKARIEMLPLIDIVFLLLVFFIYAMLSMAVHRSLPVALPSSATAALDQRQVLAVTVDSEGLVSVDGEAVPFEELLPLLEHKKNEDMIEAVALFADRSLRYQELFHVLDAIKRAGIEQIGLQAAADK